MNSELGTRSATHAMDASAIVEELVSSFRTTAESVGPWFISQMPPMYFQDTDRANQLAHLRAIIAAKASGRPIDLTLKSEDGRQLTLIKSTNQPGVLAELVAQLPLDIVGKHTQKDMGANAIFQPMMTWSHLQINSLERTERPLHVG